MFRLCFKCNRIKLWLRFVDYAFTSGQRMFNVRLGTRICNTCFRELLVDGGWKHRDKYMQDHKQEITF